MIYVTDLQSNSQCEFYEVNMKKKFINTEAIISFYNLYENKIENSMIEHFIFNPSG